MLRVRTPAERTAPIGVWFERQRVCACCYVGKHDLAYLVQQAKSPQAVVFLRARDYRQGSVRFGYRQVKPAQFDGFNSVLEKRVCGVNNRGRVVM
jgi:hypothetical protein